MIDSEYDVMDILEEKIMACKGKGKKPPKK